MCSSDIDVWICWSLFSFFSVAPRCVLCSYVFLQHLKCTSISKGSVALYCNTFKSGMRRIKAPVFHIYMVKAQMGIPWRSISKALILSLCHDYTVKTYSIHCWILLLKGMIPVKSTVQNHKVLLLMIPWWFRLHPPSSTPLTSVIYH